MARPTNRHKANEFLTAADQATNEADWDAETVTAWALCGIGYALLELCDELKAIHHDLEASTTVLHSVTRIDLPPVITDNIIHTPTINQTQRDTEQ